MRERQPYAIVTGQGRSGTNMLLDMLDLSSSTFCRNEPNEIVTSPFVQLEDHRAVHRADSQALSLRWDEAVDWTLAHMGERDHPIGHPKDFLHDLAQKLRLTHVAQGQRWRRFLGWITPSIDQGEWEMPAWLGSGLQSRAAVGVLKLVQAPGWVSFVLQHRVDVPVFHVVRHPSGFINSWINRYASKQNERAHLETNRRRLQAVLEASPEWSARFKDIEATGLVESELL